MATLTKTFSAIPAEGWIPADAFGYLPGLEGIAGSDHYIVGTWETIFGIPAGSTVTGFQWTSIETEGLFDVADQITVAPQVAASQTINGDGTGTGGTWQTRSTGLSSDAVTGPAQASDYSMTFHVIFVPDVGNIVNQRAIVVVITYDPPTGDDPNTRPIADVFGDVVAVAWAGAPSGGTKPLYVAVNRSLAQNLGVGIGSTGGWDAYTYGMVDDDEIGLVFRHDGTLVLTFHVGGVAKYALNPLYGLGPASNWTAPAAITGGVAGMLSSGRAMHLLWAIRNTTALYFRQCKDARGAAWTTEEPLFGTVDGLSAAAAWLDNQFGALFGQSGTVYFTQTPTPESWPGSAGAIGQTGVVWGLVHDDARRLCGLVDKTPVASRDAGGSWQAATALALSDRPRCMASLRHLVAILQLDGGGIRHWVSQDGGDNWV